MNVVARSKLRNITLWRLEKKGIWFLVQNRMFKKVLVFCLEPCLFVKLLFVKYSEVIMTTKMFAFVYGTLKRGEPNHYWLTETANGSGTFVGTGVTQNLYPLVIASRYNIPFLIDKLGTGKVRNDNQLICMNDRQ